MTTISDEQILNYVAANIDSFHESRLAGLNKLKLDGLVTSKNPYLYKSKNIETVSELVRAMLDARLSSQEEGLFGDFLEGLAVYIATVALDGWKSSATGIDLEFSKDNIRYIVSIKSGPNWGNSGQLADMRASFRNAVQVIRQGNRNADVRAINGCCYGRDSKPDKGTHFKICGQDFWELISNDRELYTRIIEPLGHNARQRNDRFMQDYAPVINRFSVEFTQRFCDDIGSIDWDKLVRYCSAATPLLSRPLSTKYAVNRLPCVINACDVLRHWQFPDLADRITFLAYDVGGENGNQPLTLESIRGFLMVLGTIQSDVNIRVTSTPEGLLTAEWRFDDQRNLAITFLDIDHVRLDATRADGNPVQIRNSTTRVSRNTAINRLVEQGLFARLQR